MFTLPILPDELRIPLDEITVADTVVGRFPGCVAVARPLGLDEQSAWHDAFPGADHRSQAATALVFQQLLRIEGLQMASADGAPVPFDKENPAHRRSLPMAIRSQVYNTLFERATVSEGLEKNSDLPSGSDGTSGTASSPADAAASAPATS